MSSNLVRIGIDLGLAAVLLAISIIDLRQHRIPDLLSLPLLAAGLLWSAFASGPAWPAHAIGALVGYGALALFGALFFRWRGREGLGLGDAKLFGAAGAWLGWSALPAVLLIASLGGLVLALLTGALSSADRRVPFGPPLALGFWLVWAFNR